MTKGRRLLDIVLDEQEDLFYEDSRAMKLSKYVMAERCLQVEMAKIFQDHSEGDWDTLAHILHSAGEPFPARVPAKEAEKSGSCKALPTGTSAGDPVPVRVPAAAETSLRSASSTSTSTFETWRGKQLSRIAVNTG